MTRLTGKTAVVTGAAYGPAARIAVRLATEGAAVIVNDTTDTHAASRLAADIVGLGGRAVAVEGDVSKSQDVKRIFRVTKEIFGRPDIIVNTASLVRVEPSQGEPATNGTFAVNVFGTFLMCQEAARQFAGKGGLILNMSAQAVTAPGRENPGCGDAVHRPECYRHADTRPCPRICRTRHPRDLDRSGGF
jgi:3-oxoacyl-[acyl-carrier protein] reductase